MQRIIDTDYYEKAELSYLIKVGIISQPFPDHKNPADYGLTQEQAVKMRINLLRAKKRTLEDEYQGIKAEYLRGEREFAHIPLNSLSDQLEKLNKTIYFNQQRLKGDTHQQYDLEQIKKIPISQICKVNANGFFQSNPFRTEKEPSNSLFYYKSTNRFCDFATGKTGDVIDTYMAINNCDMRTAMKELSNL